MISDGIHPGILTSLLQRAVFVFLALTEIAPQVTSIKIASSGATQSQYDLHGVASRVQSKQESSEEVVARVKSAMKESYQILVTWGKARTMVSGEPTSWVQQAVFWACLILILGIFAIAYGVIFYNKYCRPKSLVLAYLSAGDETDESDTEQNSASASSYSARRGSSRGSSRRGSRMFHWLFHSSDPSPRRSSRASISSNSGLLMHAMSTEGFKNHGHVTRSVDDIISTVGVSGMTVIPPDTSSGVTKMRHRIAVPLISLQSVLLQGGMLVFLALQLIPRKEAHSDFEELPISLVFLAIYLHFLNCTQDFPYSWQLVHHIHDFHKDFGDLFLMGGILILDAIVVPLLSLILGALYLCSSHTVGDVILNSCAVAFINQIDVWIVGFNFRTNLLAGRVSCPMLHLPINRSTMRTFAWSVVFVPVVPIVFTAMMCWLGMKVLML